MDKIHIKNLEIFANHGVFPEENTLGQKFILSATLYTSTREAGKSDDLTKSIHYGEVSLFMKKFLEEHTYQLLETVVEQLAMEMLLTISGLQKVKLKLKKPWAPVGLPLKTVSVEITRKWHLAYIALGSNMGDKEAYLNMGIDGLNHTKGCRVTKISSFLNTAPYGVVDQDDFLNGCLELRTLLTPKELLNRLQEIEQNAHRERTLRWGPRTLDLDIIFYDNLIFDTKALQIPHIEMHKRAFVLQPLDEIAPYKRHPILNKTVHEMLTELSEGPIEP